jgi:hypothetical protein
MINFTFGICTDYKNVDQLNEVISSIRSLSIPKYEILTIGNGKIDTSDVNCIHFDETQKPGWITRKKNILTQSAKYDNVVLLHDYYVFDKEWYNNFVVFGDDWDICSNQQLLINGKRHFTDWVVWDDPFFPRYYSLPYTMWDRTHFMYISGGYFLVKKHVIQSQPFNENLTHGQAEDVEWSLRVRTKYIMKCNGDSIVRHNKVHRDAR